MSDHIKWTGGVREKTEGATRILTIENGPLNLLNPRIMRDLRARLSEADADEDVLAILLTGAGDCFCGGLDIAAIQAGADPVEFAETLVELLDTIPNLGVPLAAAVNGDALASGASLVAACDYAAAADNIRIGTMEVSAGIWPMIAQVPLIHRLGARAAIENVGPANLSTRRGRRRWTGSADRPTGRGDRRRSRMARQGFQGAARHSGGAPVAVRVRFDALCGSAPSIAGAVRRPVQLRGTTRSVASSR
ncbi:enoyl-CoA hydratase/isomerase family protein [Amycolatopsis sp.]|jgi:hypothetical protein|uniref:enoyl-CoA hydratase/isomerase family protein n=1 Tax=Amycolatopsis sp. TaxID=37632 RepID=UPI002DFF825C|nr:enoyl-CoA hydratase/isomerase family protein [Amycolatopsis sp.]